MFRVSSRPLDPMLSFNGSHLSNIAVSMVATPGGRWLRCRGDAVVDSASGQQQQQQKDERGNSYKNKCGHWNGRQQGRFTNFASTIEICTRETELLADSLNVILNRETSEIRRIISVLECRLTGLALWQARLSDCLTSRQHRVGSKTCNRPLTTARTSDACWCRRWFSFMSVDGVARHVVRLKTVIIQDTGRAIGGARCLETATFWPCHCSALNL